MNFDAGVIGSIIAIVIAIGTFILGWKKSTHETTGMDASAVKAYAEAAKSSADRAKETSQELESYQVRAEAELSNLKQEIQSLKDEMRQRMLEIEDLRDWAERLVHQVISLGGTPVKMRKRPVAPAETTTLN